MNNDNLCKLNILDSTSLDHVKYYMVPYLLPKNTVDGIREYQYFGLGEEKFEKNFESFSYKINQYGFREERNETTIDAGAFGCSFTFGQGLPGHKLWHQIIANNLNKTIYNFGIPGCSAQTVLDIFCIVSKHIKMKNALILLPPYNRFQLAKYNANNNLFLLSCIPGHAGLLNKELGIDESEFYKIFPDEEFVKSFKNSVYLAEHIAKQRNISISISSWDLQTYNLLLSMNFSNARIMPQWTSPPNISNDRARDGRHPGLEHQKLHALKFAPFLTN